MSAAVHPGDGPVALPTKAGAPSATPPRRRRRRLSRTLVPLSFIATTVVLFFIFFVWPATLGAIYSFTSYTGVGALNFVGLDNYTSLLTDDGFWTALGRTFYFTAVAVPVGYVVSLSLAVLLASSKAVGKAAAKVMFFLPWLVSSIVAGVIWRWLFGENFGFVNYVLGLLGLPALHWETNAALAFVVMIVAGTWGGVAFNLLLFVAALRNIPRSYLEAAEIDGAGPWTRFFRIQLPLLAPTSFMVILLSTIGAMKEFALIQALNNGGPGTQNMLIVQYIYKTGFQLGKIGYASAASMLLMLILITIALIQLRFDKRSALS